MPKLVIPSVFVALVVVRRGNQYLLVRERKRGQGWFLPGGRAELGESMTDAAVRETLEETGIHVALEGLLRIEHTPRRDNTRVRYVFLAHPECDSPPKSIPDRESLGANWFFSHELAGLHFHGEEPELFVRYVESGGAAYPLDLLAFQGAPLPTLNP